MAIPVQTIVTRPMESALLSAVAFNFTTPLFNQLEDLPSGSEVVADTDPRCLHVAHQSQPPAPSFGQSDGGRCSCSVMNGVSPAICSGFQLHDPAF
jgi:hypothetical protein